MRRAASFSLMAAAGLALLALAACGGSSNPAAPSEGVTLRGTVVGGVAAAAAGHSGLSAFSASTTGTITVTVQEDPAITTTVGADGSFTLRGLPTGGFTLVFSSGGVTLGTAHFDQVLPNQEITITVAVSSGTVVVLEEQRNGIGHGGVEVEGDVSAVLLLSTTGDSRFVVDGKTIVARPGQTAIREGNKSRTVNDVTVGRQVHVKGTWMAMEGTTQPILASEILLQGPADNGGPTDTNPGATCAISGGRVNQGIELEGNVASGNANSFTLTVDGERSKVGVAVDASGATFQCAGGPNVSPDQCKASLKAGTKVHVSGTLTACSASSAAATARKVIVQK